jgi:hypothetical protein
MRWLHFGGFILVTKEGFGKSEDVISIHNIHYSITNLVGFRSSYIRGGT